MNMRDELKRLARIEEGPYPFCSLYLNTKWDDEQQRERIRLFTKNQLKKSTELLREKEEYIKWFLEDQKRIERYVEGLIRQSIDEGVNGVALFSCSAINLFLVYPSIIPYENEFVLADLPFLRPLVRLSSQYQNTLAVMINTESARLFEISLEGFVTEFSIESYVPGRHDQGGWSQMRYQRHIKDHMDKHHKEVAEQLTTLFDSGHWKRVVLIGQDRILSNFKHFLPERVKNHISDVFSADLMEERFRILRRIFDRLLQKEKEDVSQKIKDLYERAPHGGLAILGVSRTLEALNQGQIQTLFLLESFSLQGGKCKNCGTLTPGIERNTSPLSCPLCKGEMKHVPLGEEMMRSVLRQDGEVKWVDEDPILREFEGVGASLRFH